MDKTKNRTKLKIRSTSLCTGKKLNLELRKAET